MPSTEVRAIVLLATITMPFAVNAADIDSCLNGVATINQRGSEISALAEQARSQLDAVRESQPNIEEDEFMRKVEIAYGPVHKLCEELRYRETKEICAGVINNGSADDRLTQVQDAASSLENWVGGCEAQ